MDWWVVRGQGSVVERRVPPGGATAADEGCPTNGRTTFFPSPFAGYGAESAPAQFMNLFDLTGEVAVVIGATGALGGAIAGGLAQAGARVAVVGRNADRGEATVKSIKQAGGQAAFFSADAMSQESLRAAHLQIEKSVGAATILVNAAGGNDPKVTLGPDRRFEQVALEDWRASFDLNLVGGVLLPCQEFGAAMVKRGQGSIINIASVSAHIPLSRVVAYSAAKAAVLSLTQFLACDWATKGVRVNSITPGFFPAEQNRRGLFHPDGTPTARAQAVIAHTPIGRFGEPQELGGAALYLARPEAHRFFHRAELPLDGGFFF